ncbi:MAG: glycosyltransferase family 2 protein [Patescibacteria group bacterium]
MKDRIISFVIVTYKPDKEVLRRMTVALGEYRVIVIDNTEHNIGYGPAANQGLKKAFEAGATWAVVVNQDITLTKTGIDKFVRTLEDGGPGIVGPEAGELDPKRWTTVLASSLPAVALAKEGPVLVPDDALLYISGSFMAIHRNVWEATQGFYEPYFMYYEDADLSIRAKKAGFPLRQVAIEGFRHHATNDKNNDKEYYLARNHLLFVRRLAPLPVKIHELLRISKTLAEHHQQGNYEAIKGIGDFATGRLGRRIT